MIIHQRLIGRMIFLSSDEKKKVTEHIQQALNLNFLFSKRTYSVR